MIYFDMYAMHSTENTKKMGIVEDPLSWFTHYLSNRKQDVVINGKKSMGENVNVGVPQGSILRTQLFFNFINDIISELNCRKILFADDTSILAVVKPPLINVFS